jgi:hypothetical protein
MRHKRDSKRRWRARCRIGRPVPLEAIENFSLTCWHRFACVNEYTHFYVAFPIAKQFPTVAGMRLDDDSQIT